MAGGAGSGWRDDGVVEVPGDGRRGCDRDGLCDTGETLDPCLRFCGGKRRTVLCALRRCARTLVRLTCPVAMVPNSRRLKPETKTGIRRLTGHLSHRASTRRTEYSSSSSCRTSRCRSRSSARSPPRPRRQQKPQAGGQQARRTRRPRRRHSPRRKLLGPVSDPSPAGGAPDRDPSLSLVCTAAPQERAPYRIAK